MKAVAFLLLFVPAAFGTTIVVTIHNMGSCNASYQQQRFTSSGTFVTLMSGSTLTPGASVTVNCATDCGAGQYHDLIYWQNTSTVVWGSIGCPDAAGGSDVWLNSDGGCNTTSRSDDCSNIVVCVTLKYQNTDSSVHTYQLEHLPPSGGASQPVCGTPLDSVSGAAVSLDTSIGDYQPAGGGTDPATRGFQSLGAGQVGQMGQCFTENVCSNLNDATNGWGIVQVPDTASINSYVGGDGKTHYYYSNGGSDNTQGGWKVVCAEQDTTVLGVNTSSGAYDPTQTNTAAGPVYDGSSTNILWQTNGQTLDAGIVQSGFSALYSAINNQNSVADRNGALVVAAINSASSNITASVNAGMLTLSTELISVTNLSGRLLTNISAMYLQGIAVTNMLAALTNQTGLASTLAHSDAMSLSNVMSKVTAVFSNVNFIVSNDQVVAEIRSSTNVAGQLNAGLEDTIITNLAYWGGVQSNLLAQMATNYADPYGMRTNVDNFFADYTVDSINSRAASDVSAVSNGLFSASSDMAGGVSGGDDGSIGSMELDLSSGGVNYTLDINPLHDPKVAALAAMVKALFHYLMTYAYYAFILGELAVCLRDSGKVTQMDFPKLNATAAGFGGTIGVVLAPVVVAVILAALSAIPQLFFSWLSSNGSVIAELKGNPVSSAGGLGTAVGLFNAFFPWDYFLELGLSALAWRLSLHATWSGVMWAIKLCVK